MTKESFAKWKQKDLWSEAELQALCCGLEPNAARPADFGLNEAEEAIRRAVLAGMLPCISPEDATRGDKLYGHSRFFQPADAIAWAAGRFSMFPFDSEDISNIAFMTHTGDAGRPSAAHIYEEEFRERCAAGKIESTLEKQAVALLEWFKANHPKIAQPAIGTIQNRIRALYNSTKNCPTK